MSFGITHLDLDLVVGQTINYREGEVIVRELCNQRGKVVVEDDQNNLLEVDPLDIYTFNQDLLLLE